MTTTTATTANAETGRLRFATVGGALQVQHAAVVDEPRCQAIAVLIGAAS